MFRRLHLGTIFIFGFLRYRQLVLSATTLSASAIEFRNEIEFQPPLRLPSRPSAPKLSQTTDSEIILIVANPPRFLHINNIESEYRQVMKVNSDPNKQSQEYINWNKGPYKVYENSNDTNVSAKALVTLVLKNLIPKTQYEIRIRMNNSVGYSAYSASLIVSTRINVSQSVIPLNIFFPAASQSYIDVNIGIVSETSTDVPLGFQHFQLQYKPATSAASTGDVTNINPLDWLLYPTLFQFQPRQSGVYTQQFTSRAQSISDMSATSRCSGYFWLSLPLNPFGQSSMDNLQKWLIASEPLKWDASAAEFSSSLRSIGLIRYHLDQGTLIVTVERHLNAFNGYTWLVRMSGSAVALVTATADTTAEAPYPLFPISIYKHTLILQKDVIVTNATASGSVSIMSVSQGACWPSDPSHPILTKVLNAGVDIFSNDIQTVRVDNLSPDTYYQFRLQLFNDFGEFTATSTADYYIYTPIAIAKTLPLDTSFLLTDSHSMLSLSNVLCSVFRNSLTAGTSSGGGLNNIGPALAQLLSSSAITVAGYGTSPGNQQDYYYSLKPSSAGSSSTMTGMGGVSGESGGDGYCVAIIQHAAVASVVDEEMNLVTLKTVPLPFIEECSSSVSRSHAAASAAGVDDNCVYKFSCSSYITSGDITGIKKSSTSASTLTRIKPSSLSSLYVTFKCWGGGGGGRSVHRV